MYKQIFVISEYAAVSKRKKMKIVNGGNIMAKYTIVIDPIEDTITRNLNFMGKEYLEVLIDEGSYSLTSIIDSVESDFPDLEEDYKEIIEEITVLDEDELLVALYTLTEYEQSISKDL